jgi:hypothetical protein
MSTPDRSVTATLQLWIELAIGKGKAAPLPATMRVLRIQAETKTTELGNPTYDSFEHGDDDKGRLSSTCFPTDLLRLLGKNADIKLTVDASGRLDKVKLPTKEKEVVGLLGGANPAALLGLCLLPLPEQPVAAGTQWKTPLVLTLAGEEVKFDVQSELVARDGGTATIAQKITGTPGTALRLQQQGGTGTGKLPPAGLPRERVVEVPCEGPFQVGHNRYEGNVVLKIEQQAAAPQKPPKTKRPAGG